MRALLLVLALVAMTHAASGTQEKSVKSAVVGKVCEANGLLKGLGASLVTTAGEAEKTLSELKGIVARISAVMEARQTQGTLRCEAQGTVRAAEQALETATAALAGAERTLRSAAPTARKAQEALTHIAGKVDGLVETLATYKGANAGPVCITDNGTPKGATSTPTNWKATHCETTTVNASTPALLQSVLNKIRAAGKMSNSNAPTAGTASAAADGGALILIGGTGTAFTAAANTGSTTDPCNFFSSHSGGNNAMFKDAEAAATMGGLWQIMPAGGAGAGVNLIAAGTNKHPVKDLAAHPALSDTVRRCESAIEAMNGEQSNSFAKRIAAVKHALHKPMQEGTRENTSLATWPAQRITCKKPPTPATTAKDHDATSNRGNGADDATEAASQTTTGKADTTKEGTMHTRALIHAAGSLLGMVRCAGATSAAP
ncbi:hypothetical protein, conserved in T. vivax [Trypanosoma vivax Y486]|uniref:Uncharacterized protein n=1 Tax=Trypanosoma vivax (strain Y486) TaxID=1055687 RepID=F9WV04_TRYVY|nr:hypothetical protein, conserved in T. vivax [Trypanosoma vivax Y486]|eukprot:CCD21404.1 hypothetical protein, conserved in T. vivax [Trypanosoma vivax Y486]